MVLAKFSVDSALHDTYHVIAHFHHVVSMGEALTITGAFYFRMSISSQLETTLHCSYSF